MGSKHLLITFRSSDLLARSALQQPCQELGALSATCRTGLVHCQALVCPTWCRLWSLLLSEDAACAEVGLSGGTEPLLRCRATIFSSWRATRPSQRATWRWCSSSLLRTSAGCACLAATAATCCKDAPQCQKACYARF